MKLPFLKPKESKPSKRDLQIKEIHDAAYELEAITSLRQLLVGGEHHLKIHDNSLSYCSYGTHIATTAQKVMIEGAIVYIDIRIEELKQQLAPKGIRLTTPEDSCT